MGIADVAVELQLAAVEQADAGRPLTDIHAAVMGEVKAATKRAGRGGLHQALGHAARRRGAKLEIELTDLALDDLRLAGTATQQEDQRYQISVVHTPLHW